MGRRIDVELTSSREDGLWTWRAAGARQPRGELVGSLLYAGAKVGDVVRVEAEFHVDGIEVVEVFAPKGRKERTDLLEMKSRPMRDDELVTTQRVRRDDRARRGPGGGERRGRDGDRPRGDRRPRREDDHRRERSGPSEADLRPKPKRLRPRRTHRDALLAEVADEHKPIVEQLIRDGMPGVRAAIEKQNVEAKEAGKPEIEAAPILAIAERNLSKARLAEWRDRADAALAMKADLDLRDLRSVVVAGNDLARDEESRQLAEQLRAALDERVEADHAAWLDDLESAVTDGRVVRALRLSSRPVKAGAPLPSELATTLAGQASAALAPDTAHERWATVIDALAYSPVRGAVTPVGVPSEPSADLLTALRRLADRIPAIATLFGIDPAEAAKAARKRGPRREGGGARRGGSAGGGGAQPGGGPRSTPKPDASPADGPSDEAAAPAEAEAPPADVDAPDVDAPAAEATVADAPAAEAPAAEVETPEAPVAEDAPAADETPAEVEAPEAPVADEAPATEAPAADETPAEVEAPEAPVADEAPATEAPAADEAPAEVPAPAESPEAEAPVVDEAPAEVETAEASADA